MSDVVTYAEAKARYEELGARYDREYREGRWTTNRELASQCEDAYSLMVAARLACESVVQDALDRGHREGI